ncbi:hypothetical protein V9T40_007198 [Parthenolecanium corni]|uniref:Uncharacterized protein n=1 Tax=Parthenolecanium corni TaxID=536013 RepID=A0AAN9TUI1_9HEMI
MAEATIKHGGNLSSLMSKVFLVVSVSVTCFLVYRVYVLETRVNHLEQQLARILIGALPENADVAKVVSSAAAASAAGRDDDGGFTRRKRNAQECACPPGSEAESEFILDSVNIFFNKAGFSGKDFHLPHMCLDWEPGIAVSAMRSDYYDFIRSDNVDWLRPPRKSEISFWYLFACLEGMEYFIEIVCNKSVDQDLSPRISSGIRRRSSFLL